MNTPDNQFYWDWHKHEEKLATNKGSFFLVGELMLFAAYAALRAAADVPMFSVRVFCFLASSSH